MIIELLINIYFYLPNKQTLEILQLNKKIRKDISNVFYNTILSKKEYKFNSFIDEKYFIKFCKNTGIKFKKIHLGQNNKITDDTFSYLSGIKKLNMACCNQNTIADKAFSYLKNNKINIFF